MLLLDCPEETMVQRVLSRPSGDADARRSDNTEGAAVAAIDAFTACCLPLCDAYEGQGRLKVVGTATGGVEEAYAKFRAALVSHRHQSYSEQLRLSHPPAELGRAARVAASVVERVDTPEEHALLRRLSYEEHHSAVVLKGEERARVSAGRRWVGWGVLS